MNLTRIISRPAIQVVTAMLAATHLICASSSAQASAVKPKPGQKSNTCYFNSGPKVGKTESLEGKAKPVLIGKPCSDGQGNSGFAVLSKEQEEAEEAEEAAKAALHAEKSATPK